MTQPEWADRIISEACILKNRRHPIVIWKAQRGIYSSGTTYIKTRRRRYNIIIRLGSDELFGKQLLCHELAHYLGRPRWHHNKKFWLLLKDLLDFFDLNTEEYRSCEANYMSRSINYL